MPVFNVYDLEGEARLSQAEGLILASNEQIVLGAQASVRVLCRPGLRQAASPVLPAAAAMTGPAFWSLGCASHSGLDVQNLRSSLRTFRGSPEWC